MLTPEKWAQKYFANPHGTNFNFDDPTVIPRYLHFLVASVSVAGLLVLIYGLVKLKSDESFGRWAVRYGGLWFVIGTVVQYATGIWFLLALKKRSNDDFYGWKWSGDRCFWYLCIAFAC